MIEINGFPQKAEEITEQLVTDIADMGIAIRLYDIKASHRLSKREKAGRPIIVTFKTRKLRKKEWGLNLFSMDLKANRSGL